MPTIDQGGNAFGAPMDIGTNDNYVINVRVNNLTRGNFDTSGFWNSGGGIRNSGSLNNSQVQTTNDGTVISRDVSDSKSTLTVNQNNLGSTGNIQEWKFNGDTKAYVKPNGTLVVPNGLDGTTLQLDASVSNFIITASPSNSWARGLRFRNSSDTAFLAGYGLYGTSGTSYQYGWMGVAYNNANIKWSNTGLGIGLTGTTAPSYPLHVDIGTVTGANILGYFGQNGGSLKIANSTGVANNCNPCIYGTCSNVNNVGLGLVGQGADTYTQAGIVLSSRNAAGTAGITSGNTFQIQNYTTPQLTVDHQGNMTVLGTIKGTAGMGPLSLYAASGVKISSTGSGSVFNTSNLTADRTVQMPDASGTAAAIGTTAPSSATDTGVVGEIRITSTYVYFCIATDTWVRAPFATF